MLYTSTRGDTPAVTASQAILQGLAPDGGLYVPREAITPGNPTRLPGDYRELAATLLTPFLSGFQPETVKRAIYAAYSPENFSPREVTPLVKIAPQLHILELWHGPGAAFKDLALQLLPRLMASALASRSEEEQVLILVATSGDTGKSALEGFRDVPGISLVVYYPQTGVSPVQERQMTTQEGDNLAVVAVRGNFDDAQGGVKTIFGNGQLADSLGKKGYLLSSANSINWGRLLPQVVYYFFAYHCLVERGEITAGEAVTFAVPTGNFGNILAGFYARTLGLPVRRLVCAANANKVLADFMGEGLYNARRPFHRTLSPSMDILVSSNMERLLYHASGDKPAQVASWIKLLQEKGAYQVDNETLGSIKEVFWSGHATDEETLKVMAGTYRENGYLLDPHTAVARAVLDRYVAEEDDDSTKVILSTASPFKFPGSVARALFPEESSKALSEFALLETIARKTGLPVPRGLVGLTEKPLRHGRVINAEEMGETLSEVIPLPSSRR